MLDAGGKAFANPAGSMGLLTFSEQARWLADGCDIELDILPTIRARTAKASPGSIRSWSYFTQAIADAKAARLTPMPTGQAARQTSGSAKSWDERRQESQNDWLYADLANRQRKGPMRPRAEADE
jgi:hypothetical protein